MIEWNKKNSIKYKHRKKHQNMKQTMRLLWQKTDTGEARLLRVYAETAEITIPSFIEKYPITEIGAYCFSASEHLEGKSFYTTETSAATLRTIAGNELVKLCLPDTVRIIHNAAFYNCRKLESLAIGADTTEIGSDVFINCNSLKKLHIRCKNHKAESAKAILSRISSELEVYYYDCETAYELNESHKYNVPHKHNESHKHYEFYDEEAWERERKNIFSSLLYPEYFETYDEIAPAHIFGRHIEGEGFRARQCFKDGQILFGEYDKIFQKAKAEETTVTVGRMCIHRLLFPIELTEEARENYVLFLKEHEEEMGTFFVKEKDKVALECYFRHHMLSDSGISTLISCATDQKWSEGVSSMLHWKKQFYENTPKNSYDFELDFD